MTTHSPAAPKLARLAIAVVLIAPAYSQAPLPPSQNTSVALANLPLGFEPDGDRFVARNPGLALALTPDRVGLAVNGAKASIAILGASAKATLKGSEPLGSVANYLIGRDPTLWRTNVPQYRKVIVTGVYPGIDTVFYGNGRSLEFDLRVHPGADPASIRFAYEGTEGLHLTSAGDLVFAVGGHEITQHKPVTYQQSGPVAANYRITPGKNEVTLQVGSYDHSQLLVIDPVLAYGTFFGGTGLDGANAIAVDSAGNAYIAGHTNSSNLPASPSRPPQPALAGQADAFVAKINPAGTALVYTTYLGGTGDDRATGIVVNAAGIVSLCGITNSANFPMVAPVGSGLGRAFYGGASDGFVAILNSAGNALTLSGYLGGAAEDMANAIAVDGAGALYVTGRTNSPAFTGVTTASAQFTTGGGYDVFATKILSTGQIQYSTFFGGTGDDGANAIAVDFFGVAYIVGRTTSAAIPYATSKRRGTADAFLVVLWNNGTVRGAWNIGGSSDQTAYGVAVEGENAYITGATNSPDFLLGSFFAPLQSKIGGGYDAFIAVVSTSSIGSSPEYATFLGGTGSDAGYSIALGRRGDIYVAGYTDSANFLPGLPNQPRAGPNTFAVQLAPFSVVSSGTALVAPPFPSPFAPVFSAYLGAIQSSYPARIYPVALALLSSGNAESIFAAGYADSTFSLPSGGPRPLFAFAGGPSDAFAAKFASANLSIAFGNIGPYVGTTIPGRTNIVPGTELLIPLTVGNTGPDAAASVRVTVILPAGVSFVRCQNAAVTCTASGSIVTINYPSLAATTITPQIVAKASAKLNNAFDLPINAMVTSGTADPASANNFSTAAFSVVGVSAFTVDLADPIDFGQAATGQSVTRMLTITNAGIQTLTIDLRVVPDPGVAQPVFVVNPSGVPLGSVPRTVSVTFRPDSADLKSAVLEFVSSGTGQTIPRVLTGQGTAPRPPAPIITQVLDGAGFLPVISANDWVSIIGENFIDASIQTRAWENSDFRNGRMPVNLSGVSVKINGKDAYVEYISPTQINVLAPRDPQTGIVSVSIVTPSGSAGATVQKDAISPGLFKTDAGYVAATSGTNSAGTPANPVRNGQVLTLYMAGLGDANPPYDDGTPVSNLVFLPVKPIVIIGGLQATVDYAGMVRSLAGLYQLNVFVPAGLAPGDYPVTVQLSGKSAQPRVLVSVIQ